MYEYPTNLTDKQWQVIKNMLDPKERFRKYSLLSVFGSILYIVKTRVRWRMLSDFAPWQTVYYYFSIVRRLSGRTDSPQSGNHRLKEHQALTPRGRSKGDRRQQKYKGAGGTHRG